MIWTDENAEQPSETDETISIVEKKKGRVKKGQAAAPAADASAADQGKEKKKKDKKKKKEKKNKEAVLVRFELEQLAQIDARAESLGLNRAAWLRMTVAQVLANS